MNNDDTALFDTHAHLVADDQIKYPRNPLPPNPDGPKRLPGTVGRPGGHHGLNPIHEVPDVERMLRWMKEENIQGAIAVQKRMIYRYDNSYILDSCDKYPDVFGSMVIPDPQDPATPGQIRDWTLNHGLSSVRMFGWYKENEPTPWLNSPQALKVWEVAQELGLVIDIEFIAPGGGGVGISSILELHAAYPDVPIALDHMLDPHVTDPNFGMDERYEKLIGHPSIFQKFTSINLDILRENGVDTAKFLRRAVDMYGARQLMWGSDIGTSHGTYKDMVARLKQASTLLNDDERRAVWSETGQRVFVRGGMKGNPTRV